MVRPTKTIEYELRLYITGATPRSMLAVARIRDFCETHLHGRYHLEVVDIYQSPQLARDQQIVAVPTLIRKSPKPLRRFIGDLKHPQRILLDVDLRKLTKDERNS